MGKADVWKESKQPYTIVKNTRTGREVLCKKELAKKKDRAGEWKIIAQEGEKKYDQKIKDKMSK